MRLHWGAGIAATYVAFAAATSGFVAFAMSQRVELVRPDYYEYSLAHDAHRAAAARAAALGQSFAIDVSADGRRVTVAWPGAQAGAARGAIELYRPSDVTADRRIDVAPGADGRQIVSLAGLAAGRWRLQVAWQADGVAYAAARDLDAR
jgi:hypothetical protein